MTYTQTHNYIHSQWKVAMINEKTECPDASEHSISECPDASEHSISECPDASEHSISEWSDASEHSISEWPDASDQSKDSNFITSQSEW